MNTEPEKKQPAWVWVLFQLKLKRLQNNEAYNTPRPPADKFEETTALFLIAITARQQNGNGWVLKHKFKGNALFSMYKEFQGLTSLGWATAAQMIWSGEYKDLVGERPKR